MYSNTKNSFPLLTDLYQLTMAYGYWRTGLADKESVFHLFFRNKPFNGGFTIAAGLSSVIAFINNFQYDKSDIDYLSTLTGDNGTPLFEKTFLEYLGRLEFSCQVDAVPEGTVVFPYEPMVRVQGPIIQCQLLETPLLNMINFPSLIATKAARICIAAAGESVLEFGLRRAQGPDGAMTASRAAYIGGCHATSNVLAGKCFGIPVKGTQAHSWVMIFDDELEAFQKYAEAMPHNCVLLVDTYDTLEGVKKAIVAGKWLEQRGGRLSGIRLDSGDLAYLSIEARKMLDDAGMYDTKIVASNDLDEVIIAELKNQNAQITVWGVGTSLVTAKDHPALDGVYKLSAVRNIGEKWEYKIKLSEQMTKISNPGIQQVKRYYNTGENVADVLYDVHTDLSAGCTIVDPIDPTRCKNIASDLESHDLLVPIFRNGIQVYEEPLLNSIRENTRNELQGFHQGIKRFVNPHQYVVGMEKTLYDNKINLIKSVRKKNKQLNRKLLCETTVCTVEVVD